MHENEEVIANIKLKPISTGESVQVSDVKYWKLNARVITFLFIKNSEMVPYICEVACKLSRSVTRLPIYTTK